MNLFEKVQRGLARTRQNLERGLAQVFKRSGAISPDLWEAFEDALIAADLGGAGACDLVARVQERAARDRLAEWAQIKRILKEELLGFFPEASGSPAPGTVRPSEGPKGPFTILVVGVNGVGKTTTIGKLSARYRARGRKVLLAAADTFRAAAIEQLQHWARQTDCDLVAQQPGSDPAAVAFDAVAAGKARGMDLVIVDTAGRLHSKSNLMEELAKIKRVMGKSLAGSPHEIWLVLDATTGQNALVQARMFHEAVGVTGVLMTKLDGTAKGGILIALTRELKIPIRYIGVGEGVEDLLEFAPADFVEGLLPD